MTRGDLPVWRQPGAAASIYAKFAGSPTLRDQWVQMVRQAWGRPDHPELALFPESAREQRVVRSRAGRDVPVTVFRPPAAAPDAFLYLHGGGWMAPISGKHLARARRVARGASPQA
jgi:acetyl esterase/lipase